MLGFNANRSFNAAARFRADDGTGAASASADYRLSGFTAGTRLATELGWRAVEAITVGDKVVTFDNGLQTVTAVTRAIHFAAADDMPGFAVPIHVPIGAIGNDEPMVLLPEQIVMVESDAAEALTGDPFALLPAKVLEGFRGIDRIRGLRPVESLTLHFENDEVVFADGGALMLAPATVPGVVSLDMIDASGKPVPYPVHRAEMARVLVAAMAKEDAAFFASAAEERAA